MVTDSLDDPTENSTNFGSSTETEKMKKGNVQKEKMLFSGSFGGVPCKLEFTSEEIRVISLDQRLLLGLKFNQIRKISNVKKLFQFFLFEERECVECTVETGIEEFSSLVRSEVRNRNRVKEKEMVHDKEKPSKAIEKLEEEFGKIMVEFSSQGMLEHFQEQYSRLYQTLKRSIEDERKLEQKERRLKSEIIKNTKKVQFIISQAVNDQQIIFQLKQEIKKAWNLVENLQKKEKESKLTITNLSLELTKLSKLVDRGMGIEKKKQKDEIISLVKDKEVLVEDNLQLKGVILKIQNSLKKIDSEEADLKLAKQELLRKKKNHFEKIVESMNLIRRERENKLKAEKTFEARTVMSERKQDLLINEEGEVKKNLEALEILKSQELEETKNLQDSKNKIFSLTMNIDSLRIQISQKQDANIKLDFENNKKKNLLQNTKKDLLTLQNKLTKRYELRDLETSKINRIKIQIDDVKKVKDRMRGKIIEMEQELLEYKAKNLELRNEIRKRTYKKNVTSKKIVLLSKSNEKKGSENATVNDNTNLVKKNLKNQNVFSEDQKHKIILLKKNREKQSNKTHLIHTLHLKEIQLTKMKKLENNELLKLLNELKEKLQEATNRYEIVRREKNQYSQQYSDCREQVFEMKKKYNLMDRQIKNLREEIVICEKLHDEGQKKLKKISTEIHKKKKERDRNSESSKILGLEIKNVNVSYEKLSESVYQSDLERKKKLKTLKERTNERDILGVQLVRRNDELALLTEKLKIQKKILDRGNVEFRKKMADIRFLKLAIMNAQSSLFVHSRYVSEIEEKEGITTKLVSELKQVRRKVAGLSQILEDPKNKQRWRTLKRGNEKSTYEIAKKTQRIQKKLIEKTENLVEIEVQLEKEKKLQANLQVIVKKQPSVSTAHRLNVDQKKLRKLNEEMKSMVSELNYLAFQKKEKRFEFERLKRVVASIQADFLQIRKREGFLISK